MPDRPRPDRGQAGLRLSQIQKALSKLDLLIIDEIGYVPFSERGAELFFQVVADSYSSCQN